MIGATDTLVGTVVDGRFEIRDKLGQGGMGAVYRAWQRSTEREIAVKLIAKHQVSEPMAIERFMREARLASQLSHPNTISVYDFGKLADGRMFIAMELVRGRSLGNVLKTEGALAFPRIVRIAIQICDALAAAHAMKIVHRDLKHDNVMLIDGTADLVKVLDFGLAKKTDDRSLKSTAAGIVVGTPRYIAPEAMMTGVNYPEGDLYALGVMIAEMALGRPLWRGDNLAELCKLQMKPAEHIRDVPEPLHGIVASLLDPTPGMRPSAMQLRERLVGLQSASMPRVRPSQPPPIADNDEQVTARGTPGRIPATPPTAVQSPSARARPPTGQPPMSVGPRARPPTGNVQPQAPQPQHSPWARPDPNAPPRARTPSVQPMVPQPRMHPPVAQVAPAKPAVRWLPYAGALLAVGIATSVVVAVSVGGSKSDAPAAKATEPETPQAVPTAVEAPADAAVAQAAIIDAAALAPNTAAECLAIGDHPEKAACIRSYCVANPSDEACTTDEPSSKLAPTPSKIVAPTECLKLRGDAQQTCLRTYCAQNPGYQYCAPETVPATRDSGLAPKCLAMKDTKQGAECLAFYCMKIPYDPICDTQLDPDIDAPGSKPAKTAASTKKPPPATSKKATTNPGKGPEKNVGDLKNPFASSSTKKAAPKDDTGLVKPDDAPPAAGATCASGASKCSVQYCVKHPTDVRCDVE